VPTLTSEEYACIADGMKQLSRSLQERKGELGLIAKQKVDSAETTLSAALAFAESRHAILPDNSNCLKPDAIHQIVLAQVASAARRTQKVKPDFDELKSASKALQDSIAIACNLVSSDDALPELPRRGVLFRKPGLPHYCMMLAFLGVTQKVTRDATLHWQLFACNGIVG
jgi:hypothetical protein